MMPMASFLIRILLGVDTGTTRSAAHGLPKVTRHSRGTFSRFRRLFADTYAQRLEDQMGKGLLLWLIGIPIPIILVIWLVGGLN
jgi:hypothetical protein